MEQVLEINILAAKVTLDFSIPAFVFVFLHLIFSTFWGQPAYRFLQGTSSLKSLTIRVRLLPWWMVVLDLKSFIGQTKSSSLFSSSLSSLLSSSPAFSSLLSTSIPSSSCPSTSTSSSAPLSMSTPQQREEVVWLLAQPKTCPRKKSWHLEHRRWGNTLSFNFSWTWPLLTPESDILLSEIGKLDEV